MPLMLAVQSVLLLILLAICCFAPGFFFVRRLRWSPMEKFCGSVGLSLILIYLISWVLYLGSVRDNGIWMETRAFALISAVCIVLVFACRKDALRMLGTFRVRHAVLGYAFLLVWTFLLLGMIRVYSGAGWAGDWMEHFQRTLFFLWRLPKDTPFSGIYPLPSRPPMMNVLAAYFLTQTEDRFELFQIVFAALNLLIVLPCCLISPAITGARRIRILPLVALFALNPMVMENATYPWTKSLSGFFVVLGVAFYISAWRKSDRSRMVAAFLSLAAGVLVHYSAGPYVLFLTLHYVFWLFWRRSNKVAEMATVFALCALLLMSWFAWSIRMYGTATFLSNTSVTSSQRYEGSNAVKVAANIFDSVVPFLLRDPSLIRTFEQRNPMGMLRDVAFLFYQVNIVFALGIAGGPVVTWLLIRRFRQQSRTLTPEWIFWIAFIVFCAVVGIAVAGERDYFGLAHLTLFPLEVLGLTFLTNVFSHRSFLTWVVVAGCFVDFSFGILLNAHVQSLENDYGKVVFAGLEFSGSATRRASRSPDALSDFAWPNWFEKHYLALCDKWLVDLPGQNRNNPAFDSAWPAAKAQILKMRDQDKEFWGGWYSRHNGEIEHLGDHGAAGFGENVPAAILLVLMMGLIASVIKQTPTALPRFKNRAAAANG